MEDYLVLVKPKGCRHPCRMVRVTARSAEDAERIANEWQQERDDLGHNYLSDGDPVLLKYIYWLRQLKRDWEPVPTAESEEQGV
jgi:hypothetical protein